MIVLCIHDSVCLVDARTLSVGGSPFEHTALCGSHDENKQFLGGPLPAPPARASPAKSAQPGDTGPAAHITTRFTVTSLLCGNSHTMAPPPPPPSGAAQELKGQELVGGAAEGEILHTDVGLSFWGGVDPLDGTVIDHTHPL
jgi:hypothetical protein